MWQIKWTLTLAGFFLATISYLYLQNKALKEEILQTKAMSKIRQEAQKAYAKKQELELQKLRQKQPKVRIKYEKVVQKDESCEAELQAIKQAINVFENR